MNLYQEVALSFKKVGDPCYSHSNTVLLSKELREGERNPDILCDPIFLKRLFRNNYYICRKNAVSNLTGL